MSLRHMVGLSTIAVVALTLQPVSASAQQKSLKEQLVGTWTLVSLDNVLPDGKKQEPYGAKPKGILIFDANGHYSIMHVPADRKKFKSANRVETTPEEAATVMRGSFAQFGTWSVDEADKTITQKIEGALIPNADGTDSKRVITSLTPDELKWSTSGIAIGGRNESVYRRAK